VESARTILTDDAAIALRGALAESPGLVTIAGTGSIAFGRDASGRTARAGGWGFVFGDEGGAFDIARRALRAALRLEEGWGPETLLRSVLLDASGARDVNDLLHRCYTAEFSRARIAAFARLVDSAAEHGDTCARVILDDAARELALIARAVRERLFPAPSAAIVSYVGGVFRSRAVLARFRELIEQDGARLAPPAHGPAAGALLEAYRAAGIAPRLSGDGEEKNQPVSS